MLLIKETKIKVIIRKPFLCPRVDEGELKNRMLDIKPKMKH